MSGNIIDENIQELVDAINASTRWRTVASCQGHPEDAEKDHAFVTLELLEKDLGDYEFFHSLLDFEIHASFGHNNHIVLSHPWRQYGEMPTIEEKRKYNQQFITRTTSLIEKHLKNQHNE